MPTEIPSAARTGAAEEVGPHAGSAQNEAPGADAPGVVASAAAMPSRSEGSASTTTPGIPHRGTSRPAGPAPRRDRSRATSSGVPEVPEPEEGPVPEAVGGSDDGRGVGVGGGDGSGDGDGDGLGEGDDDGLGEGDGDGEGDGSSLGDGFFAVPAVAAAAGSATQIAHSKAVGVTPSVHATRPATIGILRWRRSVIRLRVLRGISLPSVPSVTQ